VSTQPSRSRALALLLALAGAAAIAIGVSAGAGAAAPLAKCPLKPSSSLPKGEAWAFTATGVPASAHAGITSTYAHGRGTWTHGHGGGTICRADAQAGGPSRNIVLSVSGRARVSPGITQLGRRGVGLILSATVSASDYAACAVGTRATVTIFASYYEGHRDRVQLRFGGGCASENATFLGRKLLALIARNGHQVNSA
jgi:hypothetical protein